MTRATVAPTRALRRDAAHNRQRLLDAAAEVFATRGLQAGVDEIARCAGVGMGTLYRRFPTKEALIAALVDEALETLLALGEQAATEPDGLGLERFLLASSAFQAEHRGCLSRLWIADSAHPLIGRIRPVLTGLLEDAKAHGRVRRELTATDMTLLMWSTRGVIETTREHAPDAWRRHLEIFLAGMRPASEPLSTRPISRAAVDRVVAAT